MESIEKEVSVKRVYWRAVFNGKPTWNEIAAAQRRQGYDPEGYGMPVQVVFDHLAEDKWLVLWECGGSCD